jgi:hypothetical protein
MESLFGVFIEFIAFQQNTVGMGKCPRHVSPGASMLVTSYFNTDTKIVSANACSDSSKFMYAVG